MRRARAWLRRIWSFTDRTRSEREFSDELAAHIEMHVDGQRSRRHERLPKPDGRRS